MIAGGTDGVGVRADCEIFDSRSQTWRAAAAMRQPRVSLQLVRLGGYVYAIGGEDAQGHVLASVERYDAVADRWSQVEPLKTPRTGACALALPARGAILVAGGWDGEAHLNSIEYWLPPVDDHEPRESPALRHTPLLRLPAGKETADVGASGSASRDTSSLRRLIDASEGGAGQRECVEGGTTTLLEECRGLDECVVALCEAVREVEEERRVSVVVARWEQAVVGALWLELEREREDEAKARMKRVAANVVADLEAARAESLAQSVEQGGMREREPERAEGTPGVRRVRVVGQEGGEEIAGTGRAACAATLPGSDMEDGRRARREDMLCAPRGEGGGKVGEGGVGFIQVGSAETEETGSGRMDKDRVLMDTDRDDVTGDVSDDVVDDVADYAAGSPWKEKARVLEHCVATCMYEHRILATCLRLDLDSEEEEEGIGGSKEGLEEEEDGIDDLTDDVTNGLYIYRGEYAAQGRPRQGVDLLGQERDLANCLRSARVRQECARALLRPAARLPLMHQMAHELAGAHELSLLASSREAMSPQSLRQTQRKSEIALVVGSAADLDDGGSGGHAGRRGEEEEGSAGHGYLWAVKTLDILVHATAKCQETLSACRLQGQILCCEAKGGVEEVAALVSSLEEQERQQVYRDDERERELVSAQEQRADAENSFDASQLIVSDLVTRFAVCACLVCMPSLCVCLRFVSQMHALPACLTGFKTPKGRCKQCLYMSCTSSKPKMRRRMLSRGHKRQANYWRKKWRRCRQPSGVSKKNCWLSGTGKPGPRRQRLEQRQRQGQGQRHT